MLRKGIQEVLTRLSQTHKTIHNQGLYPPIINISENHSDKELLHQLKLFIYYLERPNNSHITTKFD